MKQWSKYLIPIAVIASILFIFQNCADPLEFGAQEALSENGANLPFAFEEKLDTLSYMSCSNIDPASFQPRAIYSFRVGAYKENSGIRLSEEFLGKTANHIDSARAELLYTSTANRAASLQLAVREGENYQNILTNDSGALREGFDFSNFLAPLDTSGIATRLAITPVGQYTSYFAGTPGLGTRFLEQSVRFIESENQALQVRNNLMGSAGVDRESRLTVTYTVGADTEYEARAPIPGAKDKVYGSGFRIEFRNLFGFNNGPYRAVGLVEEYDLRTGLKKLDALWDCGNEGYTFTVVRPGDTTAGATTQTHRKCITVADGESADANPLTDVELKRQAMARRVLRPEDWFIDPRNRCVVPKPNSAQCYGTANGAATVNYLPTCSGAACPHLVTVCERID